MKYILPVITLLAAAPAIADEVQSTTNDGKPVELYASGPTDAASAILVLHDWFGLSDATREATTRFGATGLRAVAVDLYGVPSVERHEEAQVLMDGLDLTTSLTRVEAALEFLAAEREDRDIVVVGYSMGARHALEAALVHSNVLDAAILVYGGGYSDVSDERFGAAPPLLVVSGSADDWARKELLSLGQRAHEQAFDIDTYVVAGARHAFAQPLFDTGANFDPDATELLQGVMDTFISVKLRDQP